MKRIVSILLCAVLLLSLAACGASAPADADDNAPASALELLETVWNSYSDDEKFPAAGGDYSDLVDTFTAKLAAAYPSAKTVSDDPIV